MERKQSVTKFKLQVNAQSIIQKSFLLTIIFALLAFKTYKWREVFGTIQKV